MKYDQIRELICFVSALVCVLSAGWLAAILAFV